MIAATELGYRLVVYRSMSGQHWTFLYHLHLDLCRIVGKYAADPQLAFTWTDAAEVVRMGRTLRGDGND